ncbi:hypothetical protein diail_4491 [Diaporthe ilicicola]|nr:hypothetical protein diail_4491 [Diaporthe ilicicola]
MSDTTISLEGIWAEAAKQFQEICGEALLRGDVKSFDDVKKQIENVNKQPYGVSDEQDDKWDKAKSVGLQSLKYMKMLLGAASQAAVFIPVPSAAANIAGSALSFVFDVPEKIKGYNDAVDGVFTEVSSALSQFRIYQSIDNMHQPLLIEQIHLVMASIVKICAHVVKYRQGRRRDRFRRQVAAIFDDNKPLDAEMSEFRRLLQAQRDVEGTVTLSLLVETQSGVAQLLESFAVFSKTTDETHQGVQALKDDNDRTKTLIKIRNTLQIPSIVLLDTRTTQTCTNHAAKCLPGTGSWIWTDEAFSSWKEGSAKAGDPSVSNVLVLSGPASSGKTLATAQIVKHLEEEKGRTYVAHYFFLPVTSRRAAGEDDNKWPVHSGLRYMAFQIARVDATVRKALGKACDSGSTSALSRNTSSSLDSLWSELKIGGSGSTYYLAFDGIENLDERDRDSLLGFIFSSKLSEDSAGRVRVLVSGMDKLLDGHVMTRKAFRIDIDRYNERDMRLYIEDRLNKQALLRHAKPGSLQQKARNNVLAKLPRKAAGSYSQLQFTLDEVVRLLSSRTSFDELDKVLDQAMNSHETAIKALQRSLTVEEMGELNELLKWVHFANERMTVPELESAMLLYSGKESIGLLEDIITSKYLAILKIDDSSDGQFVEGQDGAMEYLQKEKAHKVRHSKDQPTISMTININNVDQEIVGHFLWDLAQKAIRDQFRFNLDSASNTLQTRQVSLAVDEFEAHHAIVMRAFKYLTGEPSEGTELIGRYLFEWLPYHLGVLTQLDYEEKGYLMPDEQLEIGQNLYQLFKDDEMVKRHKKTVERAWWNSEEMEKVQKWLMNSAVVRRAPKQWREEVQGAPSPARGYFRPFVTWIIESWLRSRDRLSGETIWNYRSWIRAFMAADDKIPQLPQTPRIDAAGPKSPSSITSEPPEVEWDRVSSWCQTFLDLPDSEVDSLWWCRIAQAARDESAVSPEVAMLLFKRALAKDDPSWLCHFNLADCYFETKNISEAVSEVELTLKSMESEGCWPTPKEEDLMSVHFTLGQFHLADENIQQAAEQFLIVSKSSDEDWTEQGRVAYMKAMLKASDSEEAKNMLRDAFATDESAASKVRVLKMIARDPDHNYTISKMFTAASGDHELLKELVASIENATEFLASSHDQANNVFEGDRFAETEARGVLLYHRGVTVAYRTGSEDTKSVTNALVFWEECRDQLRTIGGSVASTTRTNATSQLAKYYFQSLLKDQGPEEHLDALSKLADEDSSVEGEDPAGFLAVIHVFRDDREKARARLSRRVKTALDILSDDQPENDFFGHRALFKCLAFYQDFDNAAAALTLMGAPDLVANALRFDAQDVGDEPESDRPRILELLQEMGEDVLHAVKTTVPDSSQQTRRIEVAKEQIEALVAADSETIKATAIALQKRRVSALQETQASVMEEALAQYGWLCNGLGPPGTICDRVADFDHDFFHCIYCASCDFCADCFKKLREQSTPAMQCSAEHVWIKIPRQGSEFYRGCEAKSLRVPVVRSVEGDRNVLEACYDEDQEVQELTLEAWKAGLAKEWDIALEE